MELTDEMIDAGEAVLLNTSGNDISDPNLARDNVTAIFEAMVGASEQKFEGHRGTINVTAIIGGPAHQIEGPHGIIVGNILKTEDGRNVRIISVDAQIYDGTHDIVGLVDTENGDFIEWWNSEEIDDNGNLKASSGRSLVLPE